MATYQLRHFSQMNVLKRVKPENLTTFLAPFADFLKQQSVTLPEPGTRGRIDYERLIAVLLSPAGKLPQELVEAFYFVDALSNPIDQENLLQAIPHLDFDCWDTPADVAVKAWLFDRGIVEQLRAEGSVCGRSRSYESYLAPAHLSDQWADPTPELIQTIERELDAWFLSRKRGRGTRVFPKTQGRGFGFLVRHGEAYRREGALKNGRSSSIVYRPEKYDVLEFDPRLGEVRIHARSPTDKITYRDIFSRHLLGPQGRFSKEAKYTLDPLRKYGQSALSCHDVPGMAWARLVELEWGDHQNPRKYTQHRCRDLLESFELEGTQIPCFVELQHAKLEIRFTKNRNPRKVTIIPPNTLKLTRDDEGLLVEYWLYQRGFIRLERDEDSPFLESA